MPRCRFSHILAVFGVIFMIFCILSTRNRTSDPSTHHNYSGCSISDWNRVETHSFTNSYASLFSRWLWMRLDLSNDNNSQNYTTLSLIGAYVYPQHISITISAQYMVQKPVYCRYFDCKKREILGSAWKTTVFPESVVHCPRRIGVEFMSVTNDLEDVPPQPIRLVFRHFHKPIHDFSICVAPLFGKEPKWIQIAEFIEHHKLEGASFFYFHIGGISSYDRKILDYYQKLGEIEVVVYDDKYERPNYAWHTLQITDCHLRSKYHSRWTAFIDIDERISTFSGRFLDLLPILDNGKIGEIQLQILNIVKNEEIPEKYTNSEETRREMISLKFLKSAEPTWNASKTVVRSDKVGIMHIHYAVAQEMSYGTIRLNSDQAVVRHYRSTKNRPSGEDWDKIPQADGNLLKFKNRPLSMEFSRKLTENTLKHLQNVYSL